MMTAGPRLDGISFDSEAHKALGKRILPAFMENDDS